MAYSDFLAEVRERARQQVRAEVILTSLIHDEGGDLKEFLMANHMDKRAFEALAHVLNDQADEGEEALIPHALRVIVRAAQHRL